MTREELMKEIAQRLKKIRVLYKAVYPEAGYLDITIDKSLIRFNNEFWNEDNDYPINYIEGDDEIWHC